MVGMKKMIIDEPMITGQTQLPGEGIGVATNSFILIYRGESLMLSPLLFY
jgi:hypothetical protein